MFIVLTAPYCGDMFERFLDLLFPRYSANGVAGEWIATHEWLSIPMRLYHESKDQLLARDIDALDSVTSACHYHESTILQRAICMLKYRRIQSLAPRLSEYISDIGALEKEDDQVLVPVPLHWMRTLRRGYNQSFLLTKFAAQTLNMPYAHVLKRIRNTGHQAWRGKQERLEAMNGAFTIRCGASVPKHVVLIDDIVTTGSTLNECARCLKQAGAKKVEAWVIARG